MPSMQVWHAQARPYLSRLVLANDALLTAANEPSVVVVAACDQLQAAVRHAQLWLQGNRCPDQEFGVYFVELISACLGLCAVMQLVAQEAPDGEWIGNHELVEKVGNNLMDRVEQSNRARQFLNRWNE